jgi:UDP-glucose 4-epimerase
MAKKTLLIGAAGFIGRNILNTLGDVSHVVGMDIVQRPATLDCPNWITGSASDSALVASVASTCDRVVFLANASLPNSTLSDFAREASGHIVGTLKVAEICEDVGVRRFVFASSGGTVYGMDAPKGGALKETDLTCPRNGYGVSKLAIEHFLRLIGDAGKMKTLSLRVSNPYGEGQSALRAQGVVAAAMECAFKGQTMHIWGDGAAERDFIHISDVARAFAAAISYDGDASVINIGSGKSVSINDILDAVRSATGKDLPVIYEPMRRGDVQRNVLCIARAGEELFWSPRIGLEEGIALTAAWWQERLGPVGGRV